MNTSLRLRKKRHANPQGSVSQYGSSKHEAC